MPNTALLVIDMQRGLLERPIYKKQELVDNINRLLDMFHASGRPVFLIRHANSSFLTSGSDQWQLLDELRKRETDIIVDKTHSSVFKEKEFTEQFTSNDVDSVVIAGLVSNGCVQAACTDALQHSLSVTLVRDGHSTWSKDAEKVIGDWNTQLGAKGASVLPVKEISF